jgi:hypothetical protein
VTNDRREPQDPVALYGLMRAAAWRCGGILATAITTAGEDDPAMVAMIAIRDQVRAVDPHDHEAVIAATRRFNERFELLAFGLELAERAEQDAEASDHRYTTPEFLADQRLMLLGLIDVPELRRRGRERRQHE